MTRLKTNFTCNSLILLLRHPFFWSLFPCPFLNSDSCFVSELSLSSDTELLWSLLLSAESASDCICALSVLLSHLMPSWEAAPGKHIPWHWEWHGTPVVLQCFLVSPWGEGVACSVVRTEVCRWLYSTELKVCTSRAVPKPSEQVRVSGCAGLDPRSG